MTIIVEKEIKLYFYLVRKETFSKAVTPLDLVFLLTSCTSANENRKCV